jgi:hypothetical protein
MMKEFRIIISELSAFYRITACMFKVIKKVIYKWSSIEIFWKKKRTSCFAFCLPKWKSHFFLKKFGYKKMIFLEKLLKTASHLKYFLDYFKILIF